jgi:protein SCO1/2
LIAASCDSSRPSAPPASLGAAFIKPIPAAITDLPLVDDSGRATSLAAFRGRYVVLTDFLSLCQDVCPLTSANYAAIDRSLAAAQLQNRVQLIELTVDPQRDTPARLHAYRQIFHAPTNWSLLTASPAVVAQIWEFFGAYYKRTPEDQPPGVDWLTGRPLTYDVDHSDVLVYLDQTGQERFVIVGLPNTQGKPLPPEMQRFLSDLGRTHQLHPAADTWTAPQALGVLSWLVGTHLRLRY